MRFTDDRYTRERRCLETALRMIGHAARTNTIRACTGLTDDRIRKLYKSYVDHRRTQTSVRRIRGKSPQRLDCLLGSATALLQTSLLGGAFVAVGLWTDNSIDRAQEPDLSVGEKLCDAYDFYCQFVDEAPLSFEHAWFLWRTLTQSDELEFSACDHCGGLQLRDRYSVRARACPWCGDKPSRTSLGMRHLSRLKDEKAAIN